MPPVFQSLRNLLATTRTVLRCTRWVHCHREPSSTFSQNSHYFNKFTPTSVQNRLAQSRFGKPFDIQVFVSNDVIFPYQPISNFVVKIFSLARYFLVVFRQPFTSLLSTFRSFFGLARKGFVEQFSSFLTRTCKLRNWYCFVVTRYQEVFQAYVNSNCFLCVDIRRNSRYCVVLQRKRDIPAIGFMHDSASLDRKAVRDWSVQDYFDITDFRERDVFISDTTCFHPRISERPIPTALLEARSTRPLTATIGFEESVKCLFHPTDAVLQDIGVDVSIFRKLSFCLYQVALLTVVFRLLSNWGDRAYQRTGVDGTSIFLPPLEAFCQPIVVLHPQQIQPRLHLGRLGFSGAESVLVGNSHVSIVTYGRRNSSGQRIKDYGVRLLATLAEFLRILLLET